jgi:hypothetical protein
VRRALGALVFVAVLALPQLAGAAHQTMVLPTLLGEYHLTYDNRKVSEADLKPLVILSPHLAGWNSIAVTPRLERCVVGETEYLDCRDRSVRSPTFLWNARVNLKRGVATLDSLRAMRAPAELEPVVTWLQSSLAFSLWLEETKLEFYQTGDVNVLRRRYGELDPGRGCESALTQVGAAPPPAARSTTCWCSPGTTASTISSAADWVTTRSPPGSASSPSGASRSASWSFSRKPRGVSAHRLLLERRRRAALGLRRVLPRSAPSAA